MKIAKCNCESEFQDKQYGTKMRVHNAKQKSDVYTCTVCGTVKNLKDVK
jgi:hypothetical protein